MTRARAAVEVSGGVRRRNRPNLNPTKTLIQLSLYPAIDRPCFGDLANMAENKMREIKAIPVP